MASVDTYLIPVALTRSILIDDRTVAGREVLLIGAPGGGAVLTTFKMRGRDDGRAPGSDYIIWTSTGDPDFAGVGFPTGSPTPIGNLIPGSVVKLATLTGQ